MRMKSAMTQFLKDFDIRGFNVYRIVKGTEASIRITPEEMLRLSPEEVFFIPENQDSPIRVTSLLRHTLHDYTEPEDRIRFTGNGKVRFSETDQEKFWSV